MNPIGNAKKLISSLPRPAFLALVYGAGYFTILNEFLQYVSYGLRVSDTVSGGISVAYVAFTITHIALSAIGLFIHRLNRRTRFIYSRLVTSLSESLICGLVATVSFAIFIILSPTSGELASSKVHDRAASHMETIELNMARDLEERVNVISQRISDIFGGFGAETDSLQTRIQFIKHRLRLQSKGEPRSDLFVLITKEDEESIPNLGEIPDAFVDSIRDRIVQNKNDWLEYTPLGPMTLTYKILPNGNVILGGELWTKRDFLGAIEDIYSEQDIQITLVDDASQTIIYSTEITRFGELKEGNAVEPIPMGIPVRAMANSGARFNYRQTFDDLDAFPGHSVEIQFSAIAYEIPWYNALIIFVLFAGFIVLLSLDHQQVASKNSGTAKNG